MSRVRNKNRDLPTFNNVILNSDCRPGDFVTPVYGQNNTVEKISKHNGIILYPQLTQISEIDEDLLVLATVVDKNYIYITGIIDDTSDFLLIITVDGELVKMVKYEAYNNISKTYPKREIKILPNWKGQNEIVVAGEISLYMLYIVKFTTDGKAISKNLVYGLDADNFYIDGNSRGEIILAGSFRLPVRFLNSESEVESDVACPEKSDAIETNDFSTVFDEVSQNIHDSDNSSQEKVLYPKENKDNNENCTNHEQNGFMAILGKSGTWLEIFSLGKVSLHGLSISKDDVIQILLMHMKVRDIKISGMNRDIEIRVEETHSSLLSIKLPINNSEKPRHVLTPLKDYEGNNQLVPIIMVGNHHNDLFVLTRNVKNDDIILFRMKEYKWRWMINLTNSGLEIHQIAYLSLSVDDYSNVYISYGVKNGKWLLESWDEDGENLWKREVTGLMVSPGRKVSIMKNGDLIFVGSTRSDADRVTINYKDGQIIDLGDYEKAKQMFLARFTYEFPTLIGVVEDKGVKGDRVKVTWSGKVKQFHHLVPGIDYFLTNAGKLSNLQTDRFIGTAVNDKTLILS